MAGVSLEFASYVENCSRTEGARISRSLDLYSCGEKDDEGGKKRVGEGGGETHTQLLARMSTVYLFVPLYRNKPMVGKNHE